jgi:hypothetical protein
MALMNSKNCVDRTIVYGIDMMADAGGRLRREQVATGRLEELEGGLCLERRRVRQVDDHLCAPECVSQTFTGDGVDARVR